MVFAHPKELPKLKVQRGTGDAKAPADQENADQLNGWTKGETEALLQAVQAHGVRRNCFCFFLGLLGWMRSIVCSASNMAVVV